MKSLISILFCLISHAILAQDELQFTLFGTHSKDTAITSPNDDLKILNSYTAHLQYNHHLIPKYDFFLNIIGGVESFRTEFTRTHAFNGKKELYKHEFYKTNLGVGLNKRFSYKKLSLDLGFKLIHKSLFTNTIVVDSIDLEYGNPNDTEEYVSGYYAIHKRLDDEVNNIHFIPGLTINYKPYDRLAFNFSLQYQFLKNLRYSFWYKHSKIVQEGDPEISITTSSIVIYNDIYFRNIGLGFGITYTL